MYCHPLEADALSPGHQGDRVVGVGKLWKESERGGRGEEEGRWETEAEGNQRLVQCTTALLYGFHAVSTPGAGIIEADGRQVTTVFTVQQSFHHRH